MKHPYLAKLLFLLLFAGFGFPSGAFAQTGSVSGRVTDSKNEAIPGATVLIEGTSLGSSSGELQNLTVAGLLARVARDGNTQQQAALQSLIATFQPAIEGPRANP